MCSVREVILLSANSDGIFLGSKSLVPGSRFGYWSQLAGALATLLLLFSPRTRSTVERAAACTQGLISGPDFGYVLNVLPSVTLEQEQCPPRAAEGRSRCTGASAQAPGFQVAGLRPSHCPTTPPPALWDGVVSGAGFRSIAALRHGLL